jgi:hypothetical protein
VDALIFAAGIARIIFAGGNDSPTIEIPDHLSPATLAGADEVSVYMPYFIPIYLVAPEGAKH